MNLVHVGLPTMLILTATALCIAVRAMLKATAHLDPRAATTGRAAGTQHHGYETPDWARTPTAATPELRSVRQPALAPVQAPALAGPANDPIGAQAAGYRPDRMRHPVPVRQAVRQPALQPVGANSGQAPAPTPQPRQAGRVYGMARNPVSAHPRWDEPAAEGKSTADPQWTPFSVPA